MKVYFERTTRTAIVIWATTTGEILIAAILYTSLISAGVPVSTSSLITLFTSVGLIILGFLLFQTPLLGRKDTKRDQAEQLNQGNNKRSIVRPVLVMLVILALIIVGLIFALAFYPRPELITGLVIILGLGVLLVLLFILAAGFSSLDIADKSQAMGLPEGSIRAIIALFLIVVWIIMSIYLFSIVGGPSSNSDAGKLAQQLFTTLSTLVVAVASFYFGSRSAASAHRASAPSTSTSKPVIRKVDPTSYDLSQGAQELPLTILGINFRSPKEVRLIQGSTVMDGTVTSTSETKIQYKITNLPNQKPGKWDLIIVNEDGGQGQLTEAFEVKTSEASEVM